jgi:hypothetical protein
LSKPEQREQLHSIADIYKRVVEDARSYKKLGSLYSTTSARPTAQRSQTLPGFPMDGGEGCEYQFHISGAGLRKTHMTGIDMSSFR